LTTDAGFVKRKTVRHYQNILDAARVSQQRCRALRARRPLAIFADFLTHPWKSVYNIVDSIIGELEPKQHCLYAAHPLSPDVYLNLLRRSLEEQECLEKYRKKWASDFDYSVRPTRLSHFTL
jgi:hypothetical protein